LVVQSSDVIGQLVKRMHASRPDVVGVVESSYDVRATHRPKLRDGLFAEVRGADVIENESLETPPRAGLFGL
jgi:hypothetical protein